MCGIIGFYRIGQKAELPDIEDVVGALVECSTRGSQATGFYSPTTGTVKSAVRADKFCDANRDNIQRAIEAGVMVGHCRAASWGFKNRYASPERNENNHPHEGERYVLVHNGIYQNAPEVKGYKYKGECDSELALSYVETFGIEKALTLMDKADAYSLVIFDKKTEHLYLYRHGNPMIIGLTKTGMLLFGSTSQIIINMCADRTVFGFSVCDSVPFFSTKEDHLYSIVPGKGLALDQIIDPAKSIYVARHQKGAEILDFAGWEEAKKPKPAPVNVRAKDEFNRGNVEEYYPAWVDEIYLAIGGGVARFSAPLTRMGQTTLFAN
jgi:hypothetical protein